MTSAVVHEPRPTGHRSRYEARASPRVPTRSLVGAGNAPDPTCRVSATFPRRPHPCSRAGTEWNVRWTVPTLWVVVTFVWVRDHTSNAPVSREVGRLTRCWINGRRMGTGNRALKIHEIEGCRRQMTSEGLIVSSAVRLVEHLDDAPDLCQWLAWAASHPLSLRAS